MGDKVDYEKSIISVTDPSGSIVNTSSGDVCKMTKPVVVTLNPLESEASVLGEKNDFLLAQKASSRLDNTTSINSAMTDVGKVAIVDNGTNFSVLGYVNPIYALMRQPEMYPPQAHSIHASVLKNIGIDCTKNGKATSPVLTPDEISIMAENARGKTLLKPKLP